MRDLELNPIAVYRDFQSWVDSVITLVSLIQARNVTNGPVIVRLNQQTFERC